MRSAITGWVFLMFLLMAFHSSASACKCVPPEGPAEELKRADAVFSGRVTGISRQAKSGDPFTSVKVTFTVIKRWKGEKRSQLTVFTNSHSAACGYAFNKGESYLVYADADEKGRLVTTSCSRTANLKNTQDDVKELDRVASSASAATRRGLP